MYHLLAIACLLSGFISQNASAVDLTVRLTGKWLKMTQQFEAKNNDPGEFEEAKRDAKLRYELRADGFLSAFDQDKEYNDNKVMGVDIPGKSQGTLISKNGKYYWQLSREWKDKSGADKKSEKLWQVEFTSGDWAAFEKGEEIEAVLTKDAQDDWNTFHTEQVVKFADDLRVSYQKKFPKVTVNNVIIEKITHKNAVRIHGDIEKMTVDGSDSTLIAKVVVVI